MLVLSTASCVATILAQKEAFAPIRAVPLQERLANAVVAYVEYMGQAIYPAHLAVLYPYSEGGLSVAQVILALFFLLIVSVIFFLCRKTYPFALTGWLWFVGMLVPMIGIVQVGSQPRADRYTYLPEIGLYILVTWGAIELLKSWRHKREVLAIAALLIIGALITRSYFQTSYWRNSETLWRHTVDVTSRNYIADNNLAGTLLDRGNSTGTDLPSRAVRDILVANRRAQASDRVFPAIGEGANRSPPGGVQSPEKLTSEFIRVTCPAVALA